MEKSINKRVVLLKNHLELSDNDFCSKARISTGTLWKIKNQQNVSDKIAYSLIKNLKVSENWLINGEGEMFDKEIAPVIAQVNWKDEAYLQLQKQVDYLQNLVDKLIAAPNFLNDIVCADDENRRNIVRGKYILPLSA